jgi:hypothetical protein
VHSHLLNYSRAMHSFPNYAPVMVDLDLLKGAVAKILDERAPPPLLVMSVLQHRSILWHLENLVVLADALPVNKIDVDISGSGRRGAGKQMQRLWKMYGRLVDLMQEHAQMEERVIFPAIDSTEEGIMSQKKFFFFFFFFFFGFKFTTVFLNNSSLTFACSSFRNE